MKIFITICLLILTISLSNCNRNKRPINNIEDDLKNDTIIFLEKWFSVVDIPYLLKEEKDSISLNKEKVKKKRDTNHG